VRPSRISPVSGKADPELVHKWATINRTGQPIARWWWGDIVTRGASLAGTTTGSGDLGVPNLEVPRPD